MINNSNLNNDNNTIVNKQSANRTNGSKWEMKQKQGYYPNPYFEYVKDTFKDYYNNGIRDRQSFYDIYQIELTELGTSLGHTESKIESSIKNYGFKCLQYWLGKFKIP